MTPLDVTLLVAGWGLFLFSARIMATGIGRSAGGRWRTLAAEHLTTPADCWVVGMAIGLVVQRNAALVAVAMTFAAGGILGLEQAFFVMVGGLVGIACGLTFLPIQGIAGAWIVGLGGAAWLLARNSRLKETFEVLTGIGMAILGLDLVGRSMDPASVTLTLGGLVEGLDANTLGTQLRGAAAGLLARLLMQSDLAVIELASGLAVAGSGLDAACSIVLGATGGAALTTLLLIPATGRIGRNLALCYLFVQSFGALVAVLLLPLFSGLADAVVVSVASDPGPVPKVSFALLLFSLFNSCFWWISGGFFLRLVALVSAEETAVKIGLPTSVRKMLASSSNRAVEEAERQLSVLVKLTRSELDDSLNLLVSGTPSGIQEGETSRNFERVRDSLDNLLFELASSAPGKETARSLRELAARVRKLDELHEATGTLQRRLEWGLFVQSFVVPEWMKPDLERAIEALDAVWVRQATDLRSSAPTAAAAPDKHLSEMEDRFFHEAAEPGRNRVEQTSWLHGILGALRSITQRMIALGSNRSAE